ncbi:hypothetical protein ACJX0J_030961, partial [Zea mays]
FSCVVVLGTGVPAFVVVRRVPSFGFLLKRRWMVALEPGCAIGCFCFLERRSSFSALIPNSLLAPSIKLMMFVFLSQ